MYVAERTRKFAVNNNLNQLPNTNLPNKYTNHKVGVSLYIIGHISLNEKVVNSMCSNSSVIRVMDCTVSNIRTIHTSTEVKVYCIATQLESLTTITYLRMFDSVKYYWMKYYLWNIIANYSYSFKKINQYIYMW